MIKYIAMKKNKTAKYIIYILIAALLLCGLSGCASWDNFRNAFFNNNTVEPEPSENVKIAILEPQSGEAAENAADEIAGIILANEWFDTVLSRKIELVFYDNTSDVDESAAMAKAITESDAALAIGSYGNMLSLAAGDVFKEAEYPAVNATCSNPLITQLNPFYISVNSIDTYESIAAAEFIAKGLGIEKAAALYIAGNDFSKAKADAFAEKAAELAESDSVLSVAVPEAAEDFNEFFEILEQADVEAVYLPENVETAKDIIQDAKTLGFQFKWIGPGSWDVLSINDVYYTMEFDVDNHMSMLSKDFYDKFAEKYGKDAIPSENFALGFDAYLAAITAIRNANTTEDKTAIAAALRAIDKLQAATGEISINGYGSAAKPVHIHLITENGIRDVYTCTPEI